MVYEFGKLSSLQHMYYTSKIIWLFVYDPINRVRIVYKKVK